MTTSKTVYYVDGVPHVVRQEHVDIEEYKKTSRFEQEARNNKYNHIKQEA
jgi:hypothetical protein